MIDAIEHFIDGVYLGIKGLLSPSKEYYKIMADREKQRVQRVAGSRVERMMRHDIDCSGMTPARVSTEYESFLDSRHIIDPGYDIKRIIIIAGFVVLFALGISLATTLTDRGAIAGTVVLTMFGCGFSCGAILSRWFSKRSLIGICRTLARNPRSKYGVSGLIKGTVVFECVKKRVRDMGFELTPNPSGWTQWAVLLDEAKK